MCHHLLNHGDATAGACASVGHLECSSIAATPQPAVSLKCPANIVHAMAQKCRSDAASAHLLPQASCSLTAQAHTSICWVRIHVTSQCALRRLLTLLVIFPQARSLHNSRGVCLLDSLLCHRSGALARLGGGRVGFPVGEGEARNSGRSRRRPQFDTIPAHAVRHNRGQATTISKQRS